MNFKIIVYMSLGLIVVFLLSTSIVIYGGFYDPWSYYRYEQLMKELSDSSHYVVVPLRDFDSTISDERIVVGLRHDIDHDLEGALKMAEIERRYGLKSSYYVLHTAPYYGITGKGFAEHNETILPVLHKIQDMGHEIGFHNDLITLQVVYGINSTKYLHDELTWLRSNGINVTGTVAHGGYYRSKYGYQNYYFWARHTDRPVEKFYNASKIKSYNVSKVHVENITHIIKTHSLEEYKLSYEGYFMKTSYVYYRDSCGRWWYAGDPFHELKHHKKGDRMIILTHPVHWSENPYLKELGRLIRI